MAARQDDEHLIEHNYDGIQEYDNPLPRWWVYLFYATIVFSILYALNVPGIGIGKGRIADYEADVAAFRAAHPQDAETVSPEQLAALAADPSALEAGKQVYVTNCASCHRADGGGMIGPNLADDAWIHGGTLANIHTTIVEGVLAKGMPNWGKLLKPDQVNAVTIYVASLKGTNPVDGKAPEGTPVTP
ncbi:MAG: c-type cytochrome [Gemmatimonadetes bacterium]|nr:c-type cytochrome [Gemmatimonadota bacterium]MCC6771242.1 c-type cytochrome [Gemmatimonadaceae bacterium]